MAFKYTYIILHLNYVKIGPLFSLELILINRKKTKWRKRTGNVLSKRIITSLAAMRFLVQVYRITFRGRGTSMKWFISLWCLFYCPSIHLSAYPSIRRSIDLSFRLSAYPSIRPSVYLSIRRSVYPSIHLSVDPAI